METELKNFDADFQHTMHKINNNISFLENELDMMAISCWVTKLSQPAATLQEKSTRNEYVNYLSYMLKRRMIHQPFTDPPPCGPLPPLNISTPGSSCNECMHRQDEPSKGSECDDQFVSFGTPQAHSSPENTIYMTPEERMENETSYSFMNPVAVSTPTSSRRRENMQAETPKRKIRGPTCSPCSRSKNKIMETPRDETSDPEEKKNPCPEPPKQFSSPPDYAKYSSEVDDSPFLESLPGSEETNEQVRSILASVEDDTRLFDFVRMISPHLCDQGHVINYVTTAELASFKEFVESMYRTRMHDTEDLLNKEQMKLRERYEQWEASVIRRAQGTLRSLMRAVPDFKYDRFAKENDYLYILLRAQYSIDETELHPQLRNLRIKAQKKRWLSEEAERMEKANEDKLAELDELNEQLNSISKTYNTAHKDFLNRNRCLEDSAAKLRIKFHQNQKMIDSLLDQLNTPRPQ